jgi:hypothetical protein
MSIATLIIVIAIAFISHRMDKTEKRNQYFYTYAFIALAIIFLTPKFMPVQSFAHIYLGISIIIGHCIGVFTHSWREW